MINNCPRAKSFMTPCYIRDGVVVIVKDSYGHSICVGCEHSIDLIKKEIENDQD